MILGSRQSDLAKIQAYAVAEAIRQYHPSLPIEFYFRQAQGDVDLTTPLWKTPEKGFFTQDLRADLLAGKCDLVVHSWKDLPTAPDPETAIVGTLPRADVRDLIFFKKEILQETTPLELKLMTSSPRRSHNLHQILPDLVPRPLQELNFVAIRGNVQTRLRKWKQDPSVHGIVLAKAAIDRLLSARGPEFQDTQSFVRECVESSFIMILPRSVNPTAAAQGALALQVRRRDDVSMKQLLRPLLCQQTEADVQWERGSLQQFGGGCHLKIGVSQKSFVSGQHRVLRGLSPEGQDVRMDCFVPSRSLPPGLTSDQVLWTSPQWLDRETLGVPADSEFLKSRVLVLSRSDAWPQDWDPKLGGARVVAGLKSWRTLAKRGFWINASLDSEGFDPSSLTLLGREFLHLTHSDEAFGQTDALGTYRLRLQESFLKNVPWTQFRHFYWTSFSVFKSAVAIHPPLASAYHHAGLGKTSQRLREYLGSDERLWSWPGPEFLKNYLSKT